MTLLRSEGSGDASTGFYNDVINQSLKLNAGSSSYLEDTVSGTPSSTTNRAVSFWVKRTHLSTTQILLNGHVSGPNVCDFINFRSDDTIMIYVDVSAGGSDETYWQTTARFRDTANWYHIFVKYTLSESSNADKVTLRVNGTSVPLTATQTGSAVTSSRLLTNGTIFRISNYFNNSYYLDGYLAEYNVIDGDADYTDFGESKNGVWIPKAYSGSYGNSGFRLTFEAAGTSTTDDGTDNSSNMTNIGDDKSGNGNNFSVHNVEGHDIVLDSPENNWCILNHLKAGEINQLNEGALQYADSRNGGTGNAMGTFPLSSGKWYWEVHYDYDPGASNMVGIVAVDEITGNHTATDAITGYGEYFGWDERGYYYTESGSTSGKTSYVAGDIISFALDVDAGKLFIRKNNGSFEDSGDPVNGTNPSHTFTANTVMTPMVQNYRSSRHVFNFGQDPTFNGDGSITAGTETDSGGVGLFKYAPPSGYLAICSKNLPDITIGPDSSTQADDHFAVTQYEGNGSTSQDVVVGFKPDWLWFKNLDNTYNHVSYDSVRGATKRLEISIEVAESTVSNAVLDFTASGGGFSLGGDGATNENGKTIVNFAWKAGGDTADVTGNFIKDGVAFTPTQGTIDANIMSVNTTSGFSIVEFTSNVTSDGGETGTPTTVAHGLGVKPSWVIIKDRDGGSYPHWNVWHPGYQPDTTYLNYQLFLSLNNASNNAGWTRTDTGFTTNLFSTPRYQYTENGKSYIAYVFAEVEGFSKFGSYKGNGSTTGDGTFVYTGFRPRWIMFKRADSADNWAIHDTTRDPFNPLENYIYADVYNIQTTFSTAKVDYLSNGFKWKGQVNYGNNSSGTYVYMAFADQPFKFSNAR